MKEADPTNPSSLAHEKTFVTDNFKTNLNSDQILSDNNVITKNIVEQNVQSVQNEIVDRNDTNMEVSNKDLEISEISEFEPPEEIERIILGVESDNVEIKDETGSFTVALEKNTDATEVEAIEININEEHEEGK